METRKLNRLGGWDYAANGGYHVVICTHKRQPLLGSIRRDSPCGCPLLAITMLGQIAIDQMAYINGLQDMSVEQYIIMPDHIHMLIMIDHFTPPGDGQPQGLSLQNEKNPTVSDAVGGYKSLVANQWLQHCKANNQFMGKLWQRSFYDTVIRNQQDYLATWQYIQTNPYGWEQQEEIK